MTENSKHSQAAIQTIIGVSLGPGDPELITLKGLEALKNADQIYYPGAIYEDGRQESYARTILDAYNLPEEKLRGFYVKMSLDREHAIKTYKLVATHIKIALNSGQSIVVVSEGDLSTYSSFSYVQEALADLDVGVDLIPGITSYALAAAKQQASLCLQNEKMAILPRVQTVGEIHECLDHHDTVVLMKIRSVMPVIKQALAEYKRKVTAFYAERLGTVEEFVSIDIDQLDERPIPYFSLIILKKEL